MRSASSRVGGGLSPHVRGNLFCLLWLCGLLRSIPARAGEPSGKGSSPAGTRVYPRTCGGTMSWPVMSSTSMGLSPHVRGNRPIPATQISNRGSIPARAGEPLPACQWPATRGVYPRTCGGTASVGCIGLSVSGLSPHVRGNPVGTYLIRVIHGSIPARAGEPAASI